MKKIKIFAVSIGFIISMGSVKQTLAYNTNPAVNEVLGVIDSVTPAGPAGMRVSGWACSAYRVESINVHVYGQSGNSYIFLGAGPAIIPAEGAVQNACKSPSVAHRFSFFVPRTLSLINARNNSYLVTIFGISPVGGANNSLDNSMKFRVAF